MRARAVSFCILSIFLAVHAFAQAPQLEVTGRVLDSRGKPQAAAQVELIAWPAAADARALQLAGRVDPEPVMRAVTEADGRFRLTAGTVGMYKVVVRAPGALAAEAQLLPLLRDIELPALRLDAAEPLRVRVSGADKDRRPLPGVRVMVWRDAAPSRARDASHAWTTAPRLALTDDAGTAALSRGRGERVEVAAIGSDFPELRASHVESSVVDLRAVPGCARAVAIRTSQGEAVASAWLSSDRWLLGESGAAGTLTIPAPCARELRLAGTSADGRTGAAVLRPAPLDRPVPPVEVLLAPATKLAGRVLDAESRAPLANALVWPLEDPSAFTRTDAKGNWNLSVAAGSGAQVPLRAAAIGHLPGSIGPAFALQPTATIAGTVVDGAGRGVPGADITVGEWSTDAVIRFRSRAEGLSPRTVSKVNGSFRIEVLPHRAHTVKALRKGYAPASLVLAEKLQPAAVQSGVRIVLSAGQGASGRVLDQSSSQPVAGAELRLVTAVRRAKVPRFLRSTDEEPEPEILSVAGGDGVFRFEDLAPGRYDLVVNADGFAERTMSGLNVEEGEVADFGSVLLEPGAELRGMVVDAHDRPLAGAKVGAYPPSASGIQSEAAAKLVNDASDIHEVVAGTDGAFRLKGLTPGTAVDVIAEASGYVPSTPARVEVPASEPLRIALEAASRVSGRVVTEQGEPVAAALVSVKPADAALTATLSGRMATADASGAFELQNLPPGKLAVSAAAKDYIAGDPVLVDVRKGEAVEHVDLTLRRGSTIEGIVLTPTGVPATSARVTLRRNLNPNRMLEIEVAGSAQTDGDGRFRMDGVSPGAQVIVANQDGYVRAMRDIDVRNGANHVELRLGEGSGISGRVVDGQGRPVTGAAVTLLTGGPGMAKEDMSTSDGSFRFTGLVDGSYTVSAQKTDYSSARQSVQLANQPVTGVELRLQKGGGVIAGRLNGLAPEQVPQVRISAVKQPLDALDAMREGRTDSQSGYRVEGVFPGDWRVTARLPNGRQAQRSVTVPENATEVQLDLEFAQGVTLSGSVQRRGEAVANASVQANAIDGGSSGTAVSDGSGRFRIDGLKPGDHRVSVSVAQSGLRHEQVVPLTSDRDILIEVPSARASGVVADASTGMPLAGVVVVAQQTGGAQGARPQAITDANGAFTIGSLARGSYRFSADKEGYVRADVPVEIPSDEAAADNLRLTLQPAVK